MRRSGWTRALTGAALAVRFLTRLPVPLPAGERMGLGAAVPWFPLAGAAAGLAAAATDAALGLFFPVPVRSAGATLAAVLVTGALHLDGLMDTADGLGGSGGDRERALAIMRDSRVGAMGAAAGALALLLRYALVSALAAQAPGGRAGALVAAAALGRWGIVLAAWGRPPARAGLGSQLQEGFSPAGAVGAAVLAALLSAGAGAGRGLLAFGVASATAAALAAWLGRRLGGYTGDTLGATAEVTELAALAALAARWPPAP
ncbi:adenosylcobinamide-GDP ribazoletransferase [Caldinitratiruptor microaerophilus]|uniref:Adenosylcobinamide-GDP ribazoletransferase n=1 Tax=Caldinitratiruptor microaerophilus TaxID=671077 RepID=A0AA35CIT6_9FIRM|nr:adenosylcobinamide-GDP ribazoletransferase [Caldinitratiruptor microaerophilus]BDG59108.1 hypothetical protein caldi_01980 [Caldinitratiruptor microaerophilus]